MIVVCDTSPVNYLVLIDEIDLLPQFLRRWFYRQLFWLSYSTQGLRRGLPHGLASCRLGSA